MKRFFPVCLHGKSPREKNSTISCLKDKKISFVWNKGQTLSGSLFFHDFQISMYSLTRYMWVEYEIGTKSQPYSSVMHQWNQIRLS